MFSDDCDFLHDFYDVHIEVRVLSVMLRSLINAGQGWEFLKLDLGSHHNNTQRKKAIAYGSRKYASSDYIVFKNIICNMDVDDTELDKPVQLKPGDALGHVFFYTPLQTVSFIQYVVDNFDSNLRN